MHPIIQVMWANAEITVKKPQGMMNSQLLPSFVSGPSSLMCIVPNHCLQQLALKHSSPLTAVQTLKINMQNKCLHTFITH